MQDAFPFLFCLLELGAHKCQALLVPFFYRLVHLVADFLHFGSVATGQRKFLLEQRQRVGKFLIVRSHQVSGHFPFRHLGQVDLTFVEYLELLVIGLPLLDLALDHFHVGFELLSRLEVYLPHVDLRRGGTFPSSTNGSKRLRRLLGARDYPRQRSSRRVSIVLDQPRVRPL